MNHFFNQIRRKMPEIGFFFCFFIIGLCWLPIVCGSKWPKLCIQWPKSWPGWPKRWILDFLDFFHNWPLLIADCMWFQVTKTIHPMAQKLTKMTQKVDLNQDLWWFVTPIPMALAVALRLVYASNAGTTYWIPKKQ